MIIAKQNVKSKRYIIILRVLCLILFYWTGRDISAINIFAVIALKIYPTCAWWDFSVIICGLF